MDEGETLGPRPGPGPHSSPLTEGPAPAQAASPPHLILVPGRRLGDRRIKRGNASSLPSPCSSPRHLWAPGLRHLSSLPSSARGSVSGKSVRCQSSSCGGRSGGPPGACRVSGSQSDGCRAGRYGLEGFFPAALEQPPEKPRNSKALC